ncbi:MAG: CHAD domain-containing protein, partial [Hyphomicrobiales bacterium]|nr:CHAD domain-containing protein [Hyphomicrobiales bacterium]
AERGVQLLTGARPPAAKATLAALGRETTVDEALAIVIRNCLKQFTGNWPAFQEGDAGEAVHQMRVAMRRLRAVLALFARALPQAGLGDMRQEARSIASTMGMARDWDVFASLVRSGPAAHFAGDKGLAAILRSAAERSAHGHKQVQALLDDTATSRFVLRLDAYVARHGWRNGADLALLTQPVIAFAAQCLERLDRRAVKAGKHFDRLSIEEKHELRIRLKNLRYAADFFGHLFKGQGKVRRYADCAAQMQDHLGHLNDAAMARSLVAELTGAGNTQMAFAAGAITGWYANAAETHDSVLKHSWKRFLDAERYWRDDLPASTEPART